MEKIYKKSPAVHSRRRSEWRNWLKANHAKESSAWLILYRKSNGSTLLYADAVEEALCFGWIDSVANKRDEESYYLYFSKRKPKSVWSKLNRERIEKLTAAGLMMPAGIAMVELAKSTGTWLALAAIENMEEPEDLKKALNKYKLARKNFDAWSPSVRKMLLQSLMQVKGKETRVKRIAGIVEAARENRKPV
jgi:uncharacterized protein YdeI (YjbR/CyaY-like superfamily)